MRLIGLETLKLQRFRQKKHGKSLAREKTLCYNFSELIEHMQGLGETGSLFFVTGRIMEKKDNRQFRGLNRILQSQALKMLFDKFGDGTYTDFIADWKWIFLTVRDTNGSSCFTRLWDWSARRWGWPLL